MGSQSREKEKLEGSNPFKEKGPHSRVRKLIPVDKTTRPINVHVHVHALITIFY